MLDCTSDSLLSVLMMTLDRVLSEDEMTLDSPSDRVMMLDIGMSDKVLSDMSDRVSDDVMTLDYTSNKDTSQRQSRQASIYQMKYPRGKTHNLPFQSTGILCM